MFILYKLSAVFIHFLYIVHILCMLSPSLYIETENFPS
jgi:hypothetical protein